MFLTLEDLAPNALIELVENDISRTISYSTVLQYGLCVVEELKRRNIDGSLLMYRDNIRQFEEEWKEIFDFFEMNDVGYIRLKEGINTNYLRKHFRIQQSPDVLIAMTNKNSKQVLGIHTEVKKILQKKYNRQI